MARSAGQTTEADNAEAIADELVSKFDATWWIEAEEQYGDSLGEDNAPINQKHWIGVDPMEVELFVDGEFVPGLAPFDHGDAALATREDNCYSGERPGNRGLFHTGCGGGPTGAGEFAIFSLGTGIQAVGEGNYGRLGPERQRRYTDAGAETQFSQPATDGTPDEQPGAMPEIFPSWPPDATGWATPPNIDRCWTCRSMFMQAWGHYGTAWSVVHQHLGVRPHLGRDRLEVVPQVPEGQSSVQGEDIRLGDGSADVLASRGRQAPHDHHRHERGAGHDVPDRPHASARVDGGQRRARRHGGDGLQVAGDQSRPRGVGRGRPRRAPHARRLGRLATAGPGAAAAVPGLAPRYEAGSSASGLTTSPLRRRELRIP